MARKFAYNPTAAVVETTKGKIRGYEDNGLHIFKGIPYAKAERFHAPEPLDPWDDVLDTTSYGYVCPLLEMPKPNGEVLVPHRYWLMDENCMNLNLWTPGLDDKKRPVMVWLHGGGYFAGSSIEQIAYEGENMAKHGDVVVVSINHRLNILGYFDLSAYGEEYANSGNAGMDDIIAALQWVHDNVEKFGGDPSNVTIFGQSGGGGKVTTLLQMPAADGLFAKGINMSGVVGTLLSDQAGSGKELAEAMMKALKIKTVKELEKVPYGHLAAVYNKLVPEFEKAGKYVGGAPMPNAYYAGDPQKVGFRKETADIPMMVGSVYGEFTSFVPGPANKDQIPEEQVKAEYTKIFGEELTGKFLPLFKEAYPERSFIDLLNVDVIFRLPEIDYIQKRSALNNCTYSYLFNYDLPLDGGRTPWHCSDIPYFFHNTELAPYTQVDG
ncbi:MAG: carboxylesterase/lipase family protein, partial [Clostridiales bacterium]|nr:carboxylesterase/lipase family protein [Candidatus Blautia equi]